MCQKRYDIGKIREGVFCVQFSNMDIAVRPENKPGIEPCFARGVRRGQKLPCRDPFVLAYDGKYYLYHSLGRAGLGCRVSADLENWSESVRVFAPPQDFHGVDSFFWAPECHYWNGNFYIFTSVRSKLTGHRSISVYRANNPLGPFEDIAGGCISPRDWDAIDGTLYVDGEGRPWMVFVHEWTSMPEGNGGMCAARLADDFTHFVSEPIQMFLARDPDWAASGVTDGPYLYTTDAGKLCMIWSNFNKDGYVVAKAHSENGKIDGRWAQDGLLYAKDLRPGWGEGGHAMIFKTNEGQLLLSFHSPNSRRDADFEHAVFLPLRETEDGIEIGREPRKILLGTDWWTDCDDAVALRLLTRAARAGEIELLGVGINACMEKSVESLDAMLCADGCDAPIGIDREGTDFAGTPVYQYAVYDRARRYFSNDDAEDAVRMYRRLLAESEGKVEILEIGFLQVLANVLLSEPDGISPLNGVQLVEQKVEKIWVMAGKWDEQRGAEHNFNNNARSKAAAKIVCDICPAPMVFLGWEVGCDVFTGKNVPEGDILRDIMVEHGSANGRNSWDPMTALLAVIGDISKAGYAAVRGRARVDENTGENYFEPFDEGPHAYVVKARENAFYEAEIERRIR